VLLIGHLNKAEGSDPLRRLGGSIGLAAAARSVLLLARDPHDPEGASGSRRVLAHVKSNASRLAPSLAFTVEPATVRGDTEVETARLVEQGVSPFAAAELLASDEPNGRSKLGDAVGLLESELSHGGRLSVQELRVAARELGISVTTLERAKKQLGAKSVKLDLNQWGWELPLVGDAEDEVAAE
jgi:hypothetical protein